jgi:ABC-type nitrate/sulfonate/bicarbonate transport system permease component
VTSPRVEPVTLARSGGEWSDWKESLADRSADTPTVPPSRGLAQARARRTADTLSASGLALAIIVTWEAACALFAVPPWLLPPPSAVGSALIANSALLAQHALVTVQEVVVGMAVSVVLGVALGAAIARSRTLERAVYPYVIASQSVPIIAIAPLLLIWLGYGIEPKVIVVALVCFFPIVVNLVDGLRAVDPDLVRLLRTMGANSRQILAIVEVPAALPFLLSGLKVAASVSVIGAIIGEWVGAQSGLGYLMIRSASQFQTARVFAIIVILAVMGLALFGLVVLLERRLLAYRRATGIGESR